MHRLEIIINSNCDLNCSYCNRHASICPPSDIYDPEDVRNDLSHLLKLGHKFNIVCLTGGEPTINPHLWEYVKIIKELKIPQITIATNGKYLSRANDDTFDKLYDNKINLIITVYPELSRIAYDSLFDKLKQKHIPFFKRTATYFKKYGDNKRKYLMLKVKLSEQERNLTFEKCFQRTCNCAELQHGIFYKCGVMCNLKHIDNKFNTKFNDLLVENSDYIDTRKLTEFNNDIDRYTSTTPVGLILPFCKHCSAGYNHGMQGDFVKWDYSTRDRIEFIQE
jgi:organic radical activating enzyme